MLTVPQAKAAMSALRQECLAKVAQYRREGMNLRSQGEADGSAPAKRCKPRRKRSNSETRKDRQQHAGKTPDPSQATVALAAPRPTDANWASAVPKEILATPLTDMEAGLDQLRQGPDAGFYEDVHRGQSQPCALIGEPSPEAAARMVDMKAIEDHHELAWLAPDRSDLIAVWLRTRLLHAVKDGKVFDRGLVCELLNYATEFGCPDLCAGATTALLALQAKAGESPFASEQPDVSVGTLSWDPQTGVGTGTMTSCR